MKVRNKVVPSISFSDSVLSQFCNKKIHVMKLTDRPFELTKTGKKTVELRLYDEKRQQVKVGDYIVFRKMHDNDFFLTEVIDIKVFSSFNELFKIIPMEKCGYNSNEIHSTTISMDEFYSKEEQNKYEAVAIEVKVMELPTT